MAGYSCFTVAARAAARGAVLFAAAILAGCAGTGMTESVRSIQGGAPDPETPDFVVRSRGAAPTGYIPVGVTPPARSRPIRAAGDVQKLEKELAGQRERSRSFANRPAPKSGYDGSVPRPPKAGNE